MVNLHQQIYQTVFRAICAMVYLILPLSDCLAALALMPNSRQTTVYYYTVFEDHFSDKFAAIQGPKIRVPTAYHCLPSEPTLQDCQLSSAAWSTGCASVFGTGLIQKARYVVWRNHRCSHVLLITQIALVLAMGVTRPPCYRVSLN